MVSHFDREHPVKNLPDAYRKTPESNNRKILDVEKHAMDRMRAGLRAIFDSLDLDQATGKTLDLYGDMFDQPRGTATDDQYRVIIKARLARNLARADHDSIVRALSMTFGCDPSELILAESEGKCAVRLENLPFAKLNSSGIDAATAVQIVSRMIPVGVQLESMNFSGTFEFGTTAMEYDELAGFGNEEQTIGGTLGYIFSDKASDLPA